MPAVEDLARRWLDSREQGPGIARVRLRGPAGVDVCELSAWLGRDHGLAGLTTRIHSLDAGVAPPELPAGLSPREAQILGLVARGLSNREIGTCLSISEHTVANHVRAILRKTESANRTEATSFAHRHGLASV